MLDKTAAALLLPEIVYDTLIISCGKKTSFLKFSKETHTTNMFMSQFLSHRSKIFSVTKRSSLREPHSDSNEACTTTANLLPSYRNRTDSNNASCCVYKYSSIYPRGSFPPKIQNKKKHAIKKIAPARTNGLTRTDSRTGKKR